MITEQEPALEFVLLPINYYIFICDFWTEGCTARPIKSDRMAICVNLVESSNFFLRVSFTKYVKLKFFSVFI